MLGLTGTATVWSRYKNPNIGKDEWQRSVIPVLCKWGKHTERSISGGGAVIAQSTIVIIPLCTAYKPPEEWSALPSEERAECFTLQVGDLIASGIHSVEITGERPHTETDVKKAVSGITIKAIKDNTKNAHGRHLKIEGV